MLKAIEFNSSRKSVKIHKWKVDIGQKIYHGSILFVYQDVESGKMAKYKSKWVGTVVKLISNQGDLVNLGDKVLEIEEGCSHDTVVHDLCAVCGADLLEQNKDNEVEMSSATVAMIHNLPTLKVSQEQAELIGRADKDRLLKERKLVLLVDLDQTLIHTTHQNIPNNIEDIYDFKIGSSPWYHTRLRPNTAHFLREMNKYFELHICTFGVRSYAEKIANILDSDKSLFSNRILSRDECLNANTKFANLQSLFPDGDELVCIIDDRKDVWNDSPNLIPVKPYVFFTNTGDINDPNLPPITNHEDFFAKGVTVKKKEFDSEEIMDTNGENSFPDDNDNKTKDEFEVDDEDDYLLYLETILKKLHQLFYDVYDKKIDGTAHVKWVLDHLRGNIMKGCEIVFSGLVPLRFGIETSQPFHMATNLGAKIGKSVCESTTHIVAARDGTAKIHDARKYQHIKIVNPNWLTECLYRWELVDERLFPLPKAKEEKFINKEKVTTTVIESSRPLACDKPIDANEIPTSGLSDDPSSLEDLNPTIAKSTEQELQEIPIKRFDNSALTTSNQINFIENHTSVITSQHSESNRSSFKIINPNSNQQTSEITDNSSIPNSKNSNDLNSNSKNILNEGQLNSNLKNIDSLISSLKKERPQIPPPVLDFLKHKNGNSESLKKFQIPKRVRIEEVPEIRVIENINEEKPVRSPPKKRKKKSKMKNNNQTVTPPSDCTSSSNDDLINIDYIKRNKQLLLMKLKEIEISQRIIEEEYTSRRKQNDREFLLKMEQSKEDHETFLNHQTEKHHLVLQNIYSKHQEVINQLQAEHSLKMKLMCEEHEIKLKYLHEEHREKMKSIINDRNLSIHSDSDE